MSSLHGSEIVDCSRADVRIPIRAGGAGDGQAPIARAVSFAGSTGDVRRACRQVPHDACPVAVTNLRREICRAASPAIANAVAPQRCGPFASPADRRQPGAVTRGRTAYCSAAEAPAARRCARSLATSTNPASPRSIAIPIAELVRARCSSPAPDDAQRFVSAVASLIWRPYPLPRDVGNPFHTLPMLAPKRCERRHAVPTARNALAQPS